MPAYELDSSGRAVLAATEGKSENDVDVSTLEPMLVRQAAPVARIAVKPGRLEPLNTAQVIKDLKSRLKVVEQEIRLRKSLETEREQIKRLLDAAKQKKLSPVRAIRAAG